MHVKAKLKFKHQTIASIVFASLPYQTCESYIGIRSKTCLDNSVIGIMAAQSVSSSNALVQGLKTAKCSRSPGQTMVLQPARALLPPDVLKCKCSYGHLPSRKIRG